MSERKPRTEKVNSFLENAMPLSHEERIDLICGLCGQLDESDTRIVSRFLQRKRAKLFSKTLKEASSPSTSKPMNIDPEPCAPTKVDSFHISAWNSALIFRGDKLPLY